MSDSGGTEAGTRRLLDDLAAWLLPGRYHDGHPLVRGGFTVESISSTSRPNLFAPDVDAMRDWTTTVVLRQPIVWQPGDFMGPPSTEATTDNVNELQQLIKDMLASGDYPELHAPELDDWDPRLPLEWERKPGGEWTVTLKIRSH